MQLQAVPGLEITRVEDDRGLEAMITVRVAAHPDRTPPRIENLRHHLATQPDLVYVVGRLDSEPVACGFVQPVADAYADAHFVVVPSARGRGVGTAILAVLSSYALAAGRSELQGEVREDDTVSRDFFARRGYRVVGGEQAVALDLAAVEIPAVAPPPGIRIVSRAERHDLVEQLYPIFVEGVADIPGVDEVPSFEVWRAMEIDRPTRRPELFFIALSGDEPVGYATMDDFGRDAHHGLTAVRRAWRRKGVATALKQAQMSAAKRRGFERLVTGSENRNTAMRSLNEKLGYRPAPTLSTVVVRGPAVASRTA